MSSSTVRRRRRGAILLVRGVIAAVLVWLAVCLTLFVAVGGRPAERTDAVVMLGGASRERLPVADAVRSSTGTPVLVLSHTDTPGNAEADARCRAEPRAPDLVCFRPDPRDTRGEARAIGALIARHGWTSVTVVTSRYHATRARMLLASCTRARIDVVVSEPRLSPWQWLERFVTESGGVVEATLAPGCK